MKLTPNEIRVAIAAISWMERDRDMLKLAEEDAAAAIDMKRLESARIKLTALQGQDS